MSTIEEGNPLWAKLLALWMEDGREAGWVTLGGQQFKVLRPSDEEIKFVLESGFDGQYGSTTKGLAK